MRILVVVSGNHAQVAPFVTEQAEALQLAGCEVELFCVKGHGLLGYLGNLKPLKAAIRRSQPNIVHAHYGLCGLLCTLQHRAPVVVTYHGSDINNPALFRFSRLAMRRAAHNIFVSRILQQKVTNSLFTFHFSLFTSTVLPCGVDTSIFHPMNREEACRMMHLDPTQQHILFAGAFDNEVKNPRLAKEAFELLEAQSDNIFKVQSEQKRTEKNLDITLKAQTKLKKQKKYHLLELKGYSREAVAVLMNAVDCLLMTSHSEGSPQVIKEALACGCPVVSVDVGDVAEQIEGTGCGIIVDRTPEAIATALSEQIEMPRRNCPVEKIKQLDNQMIASRIMEIYNKVTLYKK